MKKVLAAMAGMFLLTVWPCGAVWQFLSRLIGGGEAESFLFPVYGGMILLAGLIAGCTVSVLKEIKLLKEELLKNRKIEPEK
ncbi:MAG: hypothetical protein MJ196_12265 [Treponemataceae bacterium]|nr:hypothetical protein [Treponemataceae bacterium]